MIFQQQPAYLFLKVIDRSLKNKIIILKSSSLFLNMIRFSLILPTDSLKSNIIPESIYPAP
ncbi:hypothetical protein EBO34_15100 [Alteribacter keqinensis]|uniref:Uncharacterized protein n=1 Tax=Alteribacter keqinensis TaxID=2483800 RepID=A0A3M7TS16_9BACI|nr:hypothetical protein EBO34_15100 [Alteribacter keqinensis]